MNPSNHLLSDGFSIVQIEPVNRPLLLCIPSNTSDRCVDVREGKPQLTTCLTSFANERNLRELCCTGLQLGFVVFLLLSV